MTKKTKKEVPSCMFFEREILHLLKIPSVNSLYKPSRGKKTKGRRLRFRKDKAVFSFQEQFLEELEGEIFTVAKNKDLRLNLGLRFFLLPGSFIRRDVDNCIKAVADSFTQAFGLNDRYVIDIYVRKHRSREDYEYIKVFTGIHYTEKCWDNPCSVIKEFCAWQSLSK